jgi:hypothetical protein
MEQAILTSRCFMAHCYVESCWATTWLATVARAAPPPDVWKASGLPWPTAMNQHNGEADRCAKDRKGTIRKGTAFPHVGRQSREELCGTGPGPELAGCL